MKKTLFEQMGGTYETTGRLSYSLPYFIGRSRKSDWFIWAKTFESSERTPQGYLLQSAYKRQT